MCRPDFLYILTSCVKKGKPAIDKHMEYYRYTGMDFVKIQYESVFPPIP